MARNQGVVVKESSVASQLRELTEEAESFELEFREKYSQATEAFNRYKNLMNQVSELSGAQASSVLPDMESCEPVIPTGPIPKKKVTPASQPAAARGRPRNTAQAQKPQPNSKNYTNEMSLTEAVWDVLERDVKSIQTVIKDYPKDAVGLKIPEIRDIIQQEKKWSSSSENISPQVTQQVAVLRHEGKLARDEENRRYYIIQNADLYGPPLGANGKPLKIATDGSYLKEDGTSFMTVDNKRIWKMRKKGTASE